MTEPRIALVTGASGGIGGATAALLAARGWQVLAASRDPGPQVSDTVTPLRLDLTDGDSLQAAADTVLEAHGRIDALVNVAGFCDAGPLEYADPAAVRRQFETNAFGPLHLTQLLLPAMRAQGTGRIVTVGTVMARLPLPLLGLYAASKAAMEAFNDVLRVEVQRFGVRAILVLPGTVRSGFDAVALANLRARREPSGPQYGGPVLRLERMIERSGSQGIAPEAVAETIHRALIARRPRRTYTLGADARATLALRPMLVQPLRDRLLRASLRL